MNEYWLDAREGLEIIRSLPGKKVIAVDIDKDRYGVIIHIMFEGGIIMELNMIGYPEEWELKVKQGEVEL